MASAIFDVFCISQAATVNFFNCGKIYATQNLTIFNHFYIRVVQPLPPPIFPN